MTHTPKSNQVKLTKPEAVTLDDWQIETHPNVKEQIERIIIAFGCSICADAESYEDGALLLADAFAEIGIPSAHAEFFRSVADRLEKHAEYIAQEDAIAEANAPTVQERASALLHSVRKEEAESGCPTEQLATADRFTHACGAVFLVDDSPRVWRVRVVTLEEANRAGWANIPEAFTHGGRSWIVTE